DASPPATRGGTGVSGGVFVCAGEASGDLHAAELLEALHRHGRPLPAFGVGGPRMEALGFEPIARTSDFGQVGLVEVLRDLPRLLGLFRRIRDEVIRRRPAVCVLVDFPD